MRPSQRAFDELRPISLIRDYLKYAEGSVLVAYGDTQVICTVSIEDRVPPFRKGKGGWLTAEYSMLPRATLTRNQRDSGRTGPNGRAQEIQRLIGRSLRAVLDLEALGEHTITIDCDVIQADGGTRTAAITGSFVALADAIKGLGEKRNFRRNPLHGQIAAVSVGIYRGQPVLDLDYAEDSEAETDMNLVMNDAGAFIEVQGTAEGHAFRRDELNKLLDLGARGIEQIVEIQREALAS